MAKGKINQQKVILTHLQQSFPVSNLSPLTAGEELQEPKVMHSSMVLLSPYLCHFLCKLGIHCSLGDIPKILPRLLQHFKPMIKIHKGYIIKRNICIYTLVPQAHTSLSMLYFVLKLSHK